MGKWKKKKEQEISGACPRGRRTQDHNETSPKRPVLLRRRRFVRGCERSWPQGELTVVVVLVSVDAAAAAAAAAPPPPAAAAAAAAAAAEEEEERCRPGFVSERPEGDGAGLDAPRPGRPTGDLFFFAFQPFNFFFVFSPHLFLFT